MSANNKVSNEQLDSYAAHKIWGEEGNGSEGGLNPIIYQGNEGICAIRSQQIVLRDYGIDVSIDELKNYAIQNGWYDPSPEGGTPAYAIGNLLESCGVHCEQSVDNTVYDLVNELAQGHRIIVGVDANELWADRNHDVVKGAEEWFKDFFEGDTPNHALIVAGVDVNPDNPNDIKVILTDPGTGDLRIEYELDDFMDAWQDSQCFMVATETPAPLQYNPETGKEEPSNFAINEYIDTNSLPLNPDNVILPEEMAAKCYGAHYSEGHIDTIPIEGNDMDYDDYSAALAKAKSVIGGGSHLPGQDHFDKESFMSALKSIFNGEDTELEVKSDQGSDSGLDSESDLGSGPGSDPGSDSEPPIDPYDDSDHDNHDSVNPSPDDSDESDECGDDSIDTGLL